MFVGKCLRKKGFQIIKHNPVPINHYYSNNIEPNCSKNIFISFMCSWHLDLYIKMMISWVGSPVSAATGPGVPACHIVFSQAA